MRERLVAAFVGFTVGILLLVGIPRSYQIADLVQTQEQRKVERSADLAAVLVREQVADGRPVTPQLLDALLHEEEHLEYVAADGTRISSTLGQAVRDDDLVARRDLPSGGSLTLSRSGDLVGERVSQALLPLVLIVLFLIAASALAGWVIACRMARPFQRLAVAAQQLGTGNRNLDLPTFAVPEAEKIGVALRTSARQIDELLAHEREVAGHASHELRTPITALRLELEDLALWPQTAPVVAAQLHRALAELDRLSAAVSDLLDREQERRHGTAVHLDLADLVFDVATASSYGDDARLRVEPSAPVPALLDRDTVAEVVALLLNDALASPDALVTVAVADAGSHLEVRIGSTRPPVPAAGSNPSLEQPRRLAAARDLAGAVGGQVVGVPTPAGQAVVLRLPKRAADER